MRKPIVLAFGRMNPPTKGHLKLVNKMAEVAKKYNCPAELYLSHSQDRLRNPLPYDGKIFWANRAFGNLVDVVESPARNIFEILPELCKEGYTDIIYVGGSDRIGGEEDITQNILNYNGRPNKKGEIPYEFDSIKFVNAGERDSTSSDIAEMASASAARAAVVNQNFDMFKKLVPYNEKDADNLFRDIYGIMVGDELPDDLNDLPLADDIIDESYFYGAENEFMSESDRYLYEDIELGDGITLSMVMRAIRKPFKDALIKAADGDDITISNDSKHPYEIFRIGNNIISDSNSNLSEEDLGNIALEAFDDIQKEITIPGKGIIELNSIGNYGLHSGEKASGTFNSFEINLTLSSGENLNLYLTIKFGKNSNKKKFTPNRVLKQDAIGTELAPEDISNKVNDNTNKNIRNLFVTLFAEAADSSKIEIIKNTPENLKFTLNTPQSAKIFNDNIKSDFPNHYESIATGIYTDTSEVIGAISLAIIIGDNSKIIFPRGSNEKLVDYFIKNKNSLLKVSAKKDGGGKPSSTGVLDLILDSKTSDNNLKDFCQWFKDFHIKVKTTNGHKNVADKMAEIISTDKLINVWESELINNVVISKDIVELYENSLKGDKASLENLKNTINSVIIKLPKYQSLISGLIPHGEIDEKKFIPNKAVFCMCKLFVNLLNNSPLLKRINDNFFKLFGEFAQIYCVGYDLSSGFFNFNLVYGGTDEKHNYIFIEDCANNIPDGEMTVKKIALQLIK